MLRAGAVDRTARLKIQGPSGKGWSASISPASVATLSVFWCHLKKPRGIVEVNPRFDSVVSRLVDGDAVIGAQRGDTLARPAIAIAGHQPIPVQDAGDEIVVGDQHQLAYGGEHVGRCAGALRA